MSEAERMRRAGDYVLGRMTEKERERAERDLEIDDAFRLAVMTVAERTRDGGPAADGWNALARHLAALPHMQAMLGDGAMPSASLSEAEEQAGDGTERRPARLASLAGRCRRFLSGLARGRAPERVAVLQSDDGKAAAVVEVRSGHRVRLLLLQDFPLASGEQLSLWGVRDDGVLDRLAGFAPTAERRLKGLALPERFRAFALGRETTAAPAMQALRPLLAEGLAQPPAGHRNASPEARASTAGAPRSPSRFAGPRGLR